MVAVLSQFKPKYDAVLPRQPHEPARTGVGYDFVCPLKGRKRNGANSSCQGPGRNPGAIPFSKKNHSTFVLRPGNKTRKSRALVVNINIYLTRLLPKHLAWTQRVPWILGQDVRHLQAHPSSRQSERRNS